MKKSKNVQGVRLVKLQEGDKVSSIAVTPKDDIEEEEYQPALLD